MMCTLGKLQLLSIFIITGDVLHNLLGYDGCSFVLFSFVLVVKDVFLVRHIVRQGSYHLSIQLSVTLNLPLPFTSTILGQVNGLMDEFRTKCTCHYLKTLYSGKTVCKEATIAAVDECVQRLKFIDSPYGTT